MAGLDLLDSKRLTISKGWSQKADEIFKTGESMEAETKQFPQETCRVQSDASMGCMGDADRLADNNDTIKIVATATINLLCFANGGTFLNYVNKVHCKGYFQRNLYFY